MIADKYRTSVIQVLRNYLYYGLPYVNAIRTCSYVGMAFMLSVTYFTCDRHYESVRRASH